jgi:hypothetical protein
LALHAKGQGERERHYNSDVSSFHLVPHLDQNFVVVITVNCEFIFLGTLWNQLSVETKLFSIFKKKLNCCEFWVWPFCKETPTIYRMQCIELLVLYLVWIRVWFFFSWQFLSFSQQAKQSRNYWNFFIYIILLFIIYYLFILNF